MPGPADDREEYTFSDGRRLTREGIATRMQGPATAAQGAANRRRKEDEVAQAEERLPKLIARLRRLVGRNDSLDLLTQVAVRYLLSDPTGPDEASEHYGVEARFEYLAGLALSCESRGSGVPPGQVVWGA